MSSVKIKTLSVKKVGGGSAMIIVTPFGFSIGDVIDVYKNEAGDIILRKNEEENNVKIF